MRDDYDIKQALAAVAKVGGFQIKRVATSDDLKDHVLTFTIVRPSEGHHQDHFAFEEEPDLVATVDGRNGHVESLDPSDLTEKDETLKAETDPDEPAGDQTEKVGAATGEPQEGIEAAQDKVVDLNSKKRR